MVAPPQIKIAFVDFWPGFEPHNGFITSAVIGALPNTVVTITEPAACDVLIYGPFGITNKQYPQKLRIFYTGENVRPPLDEADFCVSFDLVARNRGTPSSRNYRLPFWWGHIDWFSAAANGDWRLLPSYIDKPNEFNQAPKTKFCAAIFSNPVDNRLKTLRAFADGYKPIDVFGLRGKQTITTRYDKFLTLSSYRFSLCYENSAHPGYVTEKLLHAKVAGTVPIYWGDPSFSVDFNPKCCVFFSGDYAALVETVRRIDEDESAYQTILREPLFLDPPSVETGLAVFRDIFRRQKRLTFTSR